VSTAFESQPELPVAFRGYDRAATNAVLAKLEQTYAVLTRERDELRAHVGQLMRDLEEHQARSQAVGDALVTAQQAAAGLRAAAEADVERERQELAEERGKLVEEGATIRAEARREATEIVREARIRSDRLIGAVVAALEEYQRETDTFVSGTRERLVALVQEVLSRMPGSAPDFGPAPEEAVDGEPEAPSAGAAVA
jgi:cell division septum initiation protein DivIVA